MGRVVPSLVALSLLFGHSRLIQEGTQAPALDVKEAPLGNAACAVTVSTLRTEKTDDGWALHLTLKNGSDFDAGIVQVQFFSFATVGRFQEVTTSYVDTADLPIPAHGTKDTTIAVPSRKDGEALRDGEHLRIAVVPRDSDCDVARIRKTVLAEFEPPDFAIAKAEGTPFTITAARPDRTEAGVPFQVRYTVEDSAPGYAADNVRVAAIAFMYTDRLGGYAVVTDRPKSFASGPSVSGVVNLSGLRPLTDPSSKWKVAVMPTGGLFDGHQWSLLGRKAGDVASAALYSARR
jgi:hypothetical protein